MAMPPTSAMSSPGGAPMAAPTAPPSSIASSTTTGSGAELGASLTGKDLAAWTPGSPAQAHGALADVAAFCRRYCPVRLACVEERCQLYRLEDRALAALGVERNPATEAVGVVGSSIIGIG